MTQDEILDLIKHEVIPAIGCTEPMCVALCVAHATEALGEEPEYIQVGLSANVLKNAMGVGIPGTGMVGLPIAIALGALIGKSSYQLEVLHDCTPEAVERGKRFIDGGRINITLDKGACDKLYVDVVCKKGNRRSEAIIAHEHTRLVYLCCDNNVMLDNRASLHSTSEGDSVCDLTLRQVFDFATQTPLEELDFINEARVLNENAAQEALKGNYGHELGKTLSRPLGKGIMGDSIFSHILSVTSSACDARMAGAMIPVMSNSGSGNQGRTVTMPVIAYSLRYGCSDEQLARALVLSHLIAIHIKGYLGKLSALCGCVIASTGAACGLVYLRGGDYGQICAAIKNMIGNITGMVCDGAKVGCAMKVASGVSSALQSAVLAREGICISEHEGIIEKDIEKTIQNLGRIGSVGMQSTDNMILDIMVCK